jgi:hypothetical protein
LLSQGTGWRAAVIPERQLLVVSCWLLVASWFAAGDGSIMPAYARTEQRDTFDAPQGELTLATRIEPGVVRAFFLGEKVPEGRMRGLWNVRQPKAQKRSRIPPNSRREH